jgi:hypothetical protein
MNYMFVRIQKFDNNGTFIEQWRSEGKGDGEFTLALEHLYVDALDNIWQVDGADNPRIQKFDSSGEFIASVGGAPVKSLTKRKITRTKWQIMMIAMVSYINPCMSVSILQVTFM